MENKTALIVGATGLVGKYCLSYLLHDKNYSKVIVLARKELNIKDPKVEVVIVDFNHLNNYSDKIVADEIYCCLGTTIRVAGSKENFSKVDYDFPKQIAEIAKRNGAKKMLIVTAMGANENSSIFYNTVKGKIESSLKNIAFDSLYIFRPSMLKGLRTEFRIGEKIGLFIMPFIELFMWGSLKKYKSIDAMVVANAMHQMAQANEQGVFIYESDQIQEIWNKK